MSAFEVWRDSSTSVVFYFSHSDETFTTGVMLIPPDSALPKHNRPLAYENLIQLSGKCKITVFDTQDHGTDHILSVDDSFRMEKGQYHIHANPFDEPSLTFFKAEGDITEIVKVLRESFERVT